MICVVLWFLADELFSHIFDSNQQVALFPK